MNSKDGGVAHPPSSDPFDYDRNEELVRQNPLLAEYAASRKETSHRATGVEGYNHFRGDVALVHGEEKHQDGSIHQYVQRSDATGSGTYDVKWEPTDRRSMEITNVRRIHE